MPEEPKEEKRCVAYYKRGWLTARMCLGERFDKLEACCDTFKKMFFTTGNEKNRSWDKNTMFDEKPGFNFSRYRGELGIFLCGEPIQFCPWSGHVVEIRKSQDVGIKHKTKEVPDGYQEVEFKEGWDK